MPYSDSPPMAVYPNTLEGVRDRNTEMSAVDGGIVTALCDEFKLDSDHYSHHVPGVWGIWCANREPMGDRAHNWCWRCPAGYRMWIDPDDSIDPHSKETRERATVLSR